MGRLVCEFVLCARESRDHARLYRPADGRVLAAQVGHGKWPDTPRQPVVLRLSIQCEIHAQFPAAPAALPCLFLRLWLCVDVLILRCRHAVSRLLLQQLQQGQQLLRLPALQRRGHWRRDSQLHLLDGRRRPSQFLPLLFIMGKLREPPV